ncbi:Spy/CpxP family protein refolding chaperone [Fulvivirga ligni]|uniref:Spy/CpxP family protein refolding chaperone n=1 Tax=Fulvivirga ligni TaxID=2904246 RepID=UPI001F16BED5|nr:Spy/CpxP family protein refolding chaperone [Fulvivirga ligni]UII22493.1 Spy/CpxP family protein refolding chaperone [Fulvivirga ligni]
MKKVFTLLLFISISAITYGQDIFQQELFSADLVMKYRDEIKLSDKQESNIKKIHSEHMAKFNSLKWDMDALQVSMKKTLHNTEVDSEKSLQMLEKMLALESEAKKIRLDMLIQIKNQLSANQQTTLDKYRGENGLSSYDFITPISENPRVVVKVDGVQADAAPKYYIKSANGYKEIPSADGIDPSSIKSINVLKGESAIDQFGAAAKNGAIVIELKNLN